MNDKEERGLFKVLGNSIMNWGVAVIGGGLLVAIGLFYTVPVAVSQNTEEIKELNVEVKKITTIPKLNEKQIKNLELQVTEIKENQKEFQNETKRSIEDIRKTNLKMLELLYQIKQQNNN